MVSRTRIVVVALLTVGFFAGANSVTLGETARVGGSGVDSSVEAGGIPQLKALVKEQQRQLEEHRRALEVHKALLQKLERKVAELSRVSSSEKRASTGKRTPEVQSRSAPKTNLAANALSRVQASVTEPAKASAPEKEPRPPSSTSAQNLKVYWKEGLRLDSADESQRLRIGGRIMNDWGFFTTGDELNETVGPVVNGTEFRRARLYFSGRMYDRVNFKAQYDFAGEVPVSRTSTSGSTSFVAPGNSRSAISRSRLASKCRLAASTSPSWRDLSPTCSRRNETAA